MDEAGQFVLPRAEETPATDSEGRELTQEQAEYFKDSKVRDENGNLLVVYHGTDAAFTVFDSSKSRINMDIQGSFFSPWEIDAGGYGPNVKAYYLNITSPADEGTAYKALNRFKGQNEAGRKAREYLINMGYDGVDNSGEEYIAFYPEQIKRTDNESPTADPDVRYSVAETRDIPFQEQMDAFFSNDKKILGRNDDIFVMDTDKSLNALKIGDKPFFMLKRNLRKSTRTAGNNSNNSAHGISEDIIRSLPDMLKNPALVIIGDGRISVIPGIMVETEREKAAPLLVGVNPNSSVDGMSAYEIKSIYGREGFTDWLELRAKDSRIIAGNGNKASALLRDVGIKVTEPVAYAEDLTDRMLSQGKNSVNNELTGKIVLPGGEEYSTAEEDITESMPRKAADYFTRTANRLVKSLKNTLGADRYDDNGELRSIAREIGAEFISTRTRCSRTAWTSAEMRGIMNRPTKEA